MPMPLLRRLSPTILPVALIATLAAGIASAQEAPDRVGGIPIDELCTETIAGADNPLVLPTGQPRPGVEHARLFRDEGDDIDTEPGEVIWSLIEEPWGRIARGEVAFPASGIALHVDIIASYPGLLEAGVYPIRIVFDAPGSDILPGFTKISISNTNCGLEATYVPIRDTRPFSIGAIDLHPDRPIGDIERIADAKILSLHIILGGQPLIISLAQGESGRAVFDNMIDATTAVAEEPRAGLMRDRSSGWAVRRVFPGAVNWSVIEVDHRPALEAVIQIDDIGFDWSIRIGSDEDSDGPDWIQFLPGNMTNAAAITSWSANMAAWGDAGLFPGGEIANLDNGIWLITFPDASEADTLALALGQSQWLVFGLRLDDDFDLRGPDALFIEITQSDRAAFEEAFAARGLIEADAAAAAE